MKSKTFSIGQPQTDVLLQRGVQLHLESRLADAEHIYGEVLRGQPMHAGALHLMGLAAFQSGQAERAIGLFDRAIAIRRDFPEAHDNRGTALYALNRYGEALDSYDKAIKLKPDNAGAHANLGNVLQTLGRHADALIRYDRAIALKPGLAEAHFGRGATLNALKRHAEALKGHAQALALNPSYAKAFHGQGIALFGLNQPEDAIASHDRAIALNPQFAEAFDDRGVALAALGRHEDALASHDRAITLKPDFAEAFNNRGIPLIRLGRFEAALASFETAVGVWPDYAEAYTNRGNALRALNRLDDALASHDRAISLRPDYGEAHSNRAITLTDLGRDEDAVAGFQTAIALKPDFAEAHLNLSMCLLRSGRMDVGWREYDWRLHDHRPPSPAPRWTGRQPLQSRRLVLYAEQGLGDTLQFCRYAAVAAEQGATVHLVAQRPLIGVLRTLQGVSSVVALGDPLPDHDYVCPLMSLPLAFGTTLDTIPGTVPYLKADVAAVDRWRHRLGQTPRPRVGIVWNGGYRADQPDTWTVNRRRNIDFEVFAALNMPDITFVSLQKGEPAESEWRDKRAEFWPTPNLLDVAEDLRDFTDTAALIEALDLVIAVDTSVAHLAGALGKPVWILNRFDGCWRWLSDRTDSPWYPTARLFRQPAPGDWASVIAQVRQALRAVGGITT